MCPMQSHLSSHKGMWEQKLIGEGFSSPAVYCVIHRYGTQSRRRIDYETSHLAIQRDMKLQQHITGTIQCTWRKNNCRVSGGLWFEISPPFLSLRCCRSQGRECVAWHDFWSLTWTHGKERGCRCWLDISFTLGDKLLCEQAILEFQGHRMHLRDCQRSLFKLGFTAKTTNLRLW